MRFWVDCRFDVPDRRWRPSVLHAARGVLLFRLSHPRAEYRNGIRWTRYRPGTFGVTSRGRRWGWCGHGPRRVRHERIDFWHATLDHGSVPGPDAGRVIVVDPGDCTDFLIRAESAPDAERILRAWAGPVAARQSAG